MKKFLLTMAACLSMAMPAQAMVETGEELGDNYKMKYPVVYVEDADAQAAINADIGRYLDTFRDAMENDEVIVNGATAYAVKYEDEDVVSLSFTDYRYTGGAHGMPTTYGMVYDKHTGARIPLDTYLRITPEDLNEVVDDHLYNGNGNLVPYAFKKWNQPINYVPENYFLLGDGGIALQFQPYALGSFADGAMTIRFDAAMVNEYNEKNS